MQEPNARAMIIHKLSANVQEVQKEDTAEDSFIHVFQLLLNKSHYQDAESEGKHLEWVKNTYGGQHVSWILANKPLMKCLKGLIVFEYFEQGGKVPMTLYHGWSANGAKGSVREIYY